MTLKAQIQTQNAPRDSWQTSLPPQSDQAQAFLNGDRIRGVVPYAFAAIAGFIQRQLNRGGEPWLYAPPGNVFSVRPALQSTDYIHMVRDIAMKPAWSAERSIGSTPSPIARDQPPALQQVSVFSQNYSQWQAGVPQWNYGFFNYQSWLMAQMAAVPNVSGQSSATPAVGP